MLLLATVESSFSSHQCGPVATDEAYGVLKAVLMFWSFCVISGCSS